MKLSAITESRKVRLLILLLLLLAVPLAVVLSQQQQLFQQRAAVSSSKLGLFNPGPGVELCGELNTMIEGGPKIFKIYAGSDTIGPMMIGVRKYKQMYPDGEVVLRVFDDADNVRWTNSDDPNAKADEYYNRFVKNVWDAMSSSDKALIDYVEADNEFTAFDYESEGSSLYWNRSASWNWYGRFWQAIAQRISDRTGKRPIIANLPVGHPADLTYLDQMIDPLKAIDGIGGVFGYHSYTRDYTEDVGNEEDKDSLYFRKINSHLSGKGVNIDFMLTEAGVDREGRAGDGWQARGDAGKYQSWLRWFDGQIRGQGYVIGATLFQACSPNWWSFDHKPIAGWLKDYWGGTPETPTEPTAGPGQPTTQPGQPTNPPSGGDSIMMFHIKDEGGNYINATTGSIFVDNKVSDSDSMPLSQNSKDCFTKVSAGQYRCKKYPSNWYGGIGTTPDGYTVVDGGNKFEEGDPAINLQAGQTVDITIILRSNGGGPVATATPQPGSGACREDNWECLCRTTPRGDGACLAQTAPWALPPFPGDPWAKCQTPLPSPAATCRPQDAGAQPTSGPSGPGPATIVIEIKNKDTGEFIDAKNGGVFVSNETGMDSDPYNLSGAVVQDNCSRIAPGRIRCKKHSDKWYGGIADSNVPDGFTIFDGGIIRGQDTPLEVNSGGTITITALLIPATGGPGPGPTSGPGGSNPKFVPNCLNIQGPTTIRLGRKVSYLAQYSGPADGKLVGAINAVKTSNPNIKDSAKWEWASDGTNPPKEVGYISGVLTFEWTPTEAGIYHVFCRAFNENAGNAECRGASSTVDGPPRYWCKGPGASITVNVTAADADTPESQADMCEFATTIGGNVMQLGEGDNSEGPLLITAIAKPGVNVKTYSFAFNNLDNTPDMPKPIFFTANTPYVINSNTNSVEVPDDVFTKPDLNFGGKQAKNIQINAYFTDATGVESLLDPKCSITINAANPKATPMPTSTTAPTPGSSTGTGGIIATMGVLIIGVIVALNFFFH